MELKPKATRPKYDHSDLDRWIDGEAVPVGVKAVQDEVQFDCARCHASWSCPALSVERRREVADLVRRKQLLDVFALFRELGSTVAGAKHTSLHITKEPSACHKCRRALPTDDEQVVCRCRTLNLNW
jgi:hypothetical protein